MVAHERHITVTENGKVTISGIPVRPGQRVGVTVAVEEQAGAMSREQLAAEVRDLFRSMQALPQIRPLSDEEIAREVAEHRRALGAA